MASGSFFIASESAKVIVADSVVMASKIPGFMNTTLDRVKFQWSGFLRLVQP